MTTKKHDIFLSYARADLERIKPLVEASETQGWSVWWDPEIPRGKSFDEEIEENLLASRIVIVAWSKSSIRSRWVKEEAREGLERNILVPLKIDHVSPPFGFRSVQTADLVGWENGKSLLEFDRFLKSIEALLGKPAPLERRQTKSKELQKPKGDKVPEPVTGQFTDPRDGQTYKTVKLNGLTWMAENLNFDVGEGCWYYDNDLQNGKKYGRLYTWEAAKKACPPGWRLPTEEEWRGMAKQFGGADVDASDDGKAA